MNFFLEDVEDIIVLRLKEKRLDSMVAPDFKAQLLVLLNSEDPKDIVVDLSEVEYSDSSGLGALLFGVRQAREQDVEFVLAGSQKRVLSLIQIAHLTDVLVNYDNEHQAIENLREE